MHIPLVTNMHTPLSLSHNYFRKDLFKTKYSRVFILNVFSSWFPCAFRLPRLVWLLTAKQIITVNSVGILSVETIIMLLQHHLEWQMGTVHISYFTPRHSYIIIRVRRLYNALYFCRARILFFSEKKSKSTLISKILVITRPATLYWFDFNCTVSAFPHLV